MERARVYQIQDLLGAHDKEIFCYKDLESRMPCHVVSFLISDVLNTNSSVRGNEW